jgi:hypothetical protein
MLLSCGRHGGEFDKLAARADAAGKRLLDVPRDRLRLILRAVIERIELSLERVKIVVRCSEVERFIQWDGVGLFKARLDDWPRSRTELIDVPASAIRYDRQLLMPIEPKAPGKPGRATPGHLCRSLRSSHKGQGNAEGC